MQHEERYEKRFKPLAPSISFEKLLAELKDFTALYPTGRNFYLVADVYHDEDNPFAEVHLTCMSPMTKEEEAEEQKRTESREKAAKEHRRAEYEKLKKEFEGEANV